MGTSCTRLNVKCSSIVLIVVVGWGGYQADIRHGWEGWEIGNAYGSEGEIHLFCFV